MTDPVPSKDLLSELREGTREYAYYDGLMCRAADEIERLQTALRGIQSCSTCEACRGAATRALGGEAPKPQTVEAWRGKRKVTIYHDSVLRSWGPCINTEMTDEPRTLDSVQAALDWLYEPTEPQVSATRAFDFELGWRTAANWCGRDDLIADIGSPVYEQDKAKALGAAPEPPADLVSAARSLLALVQNKGQPMSHPDNRKLTDAGDVILVSEARLWMLQLALSGAAQPPRDGQ